MAARNTKNKTRVEKATEADWSFHDDRRALHAVDTAARKAAREFETVEYEDAVQDALLWLSVRPERYQKAVDSDEWLELGQDIYSHALREAAIAASNRQRVTYSKERLEEERGWEV